MNPNESLFPPKRTSLQLDFLWANPKYWKLGFLYFCPDDPRVIVSKKARFGWTLNFARLLAYPALSGMVLFLFGPFYLLGMWNIDLHGWDWLIFAVLVVLLCTFCTWASSSRRYDRP